MKNVSLPFIAVLLLLLPFSCSNTDNKAIAETPKALKGSGEYEIESFRWSAKVNLVQELYSELSAKTPELKKLNEDVKALLEKQQNLYGKFDEYDGKSTSYYGNANSFAGSVADSTLRARMQQLINASKQKYEGLTAELNALNKQIAANNSSIADQHTALKLVLTLPLMEQYQKQHLPAKKDYKDAIATQNKTLKNIDGLNTAF